MRPPIFENHCLGLGEQKLLKTSLALGKVQNSFNVKCFLYPCQSFLQNRCSISLFFASALLLWANRVSVGKTAG
jgi:hypothetical protein